MAKPIVRYTGEVIILNGVDILTDKKFRYARIFGVLDHPILGAQAWVRTSVVKRYSASTGRLETLNTIYVKEQQDA